MKQALNIFLLLTVAVFSLWCTGDLMRKNDQATILAGAHDLAQGRMHDPSVYYQYDKTYIVYWVCAAAIKMLPDGISPVAPANISLALIFWSALTVFVIRFRKTLSPLILLCFLTSPAVLLNTPYVNSTVLSSAFILLSAASLLGKETRGWVSSFFFFLAAGARADAVLLLPLLLWLITPFPMVGSFFSDISNDWKAGLKTIIRFSSQWKLLSAGALALIIGRILCRGGEAAVDPIFNWKMVAGYTVFGFGAAGLVFVLYSARLGSQAWKGMSSLEKLYSAAGLVAFLLPVLFFLPQLHAPRYFWRGCEAVLLLAVSGRLPEIKHRGINYVVAMTALLLLFVGVRLPELSRPRIVMTNPSLFPSGDGFYPMGAAGEFMLRLRHASERPVDHNQMLWSAVRSAKFEFSSAGTMPVLSTPMFGYFMLEASLRGGFADCLPFSQLRGRPFYADSRSLMRDDPKTPIGELSEILDLPARFVSPENCGIGVLRFGAGDLEWGRRTRLLNQLFGGSEYRLQRAEQVVEDTRKMVCISSASFPGSRSDAGSGLYYSFDCDARFVPGALCAQAVWPEWMSFRAFSSAR